MENKRSKVLVTGCAGFIGFHLLSKLVLEDFSVIGLDNISNYYSTKLKVDRLKELGIDDISEKKSSIESTKYSNLKFYNHDIRDSESISTIFLKYKFNIVIHLAAQAGVRYSLINPETYITTNINGFFNVINSAHINKVDKFIYASSSSVYGESSSVPFKETEPTNEPESLYAATKKSNELIAFSYSKLYNLNTVGLRFFTVYGPWGRPDMAYYKFANALFKEKEIEIYNNGKMKRDFTYIDDIIEGIKRVIFSNFTSNKEGINHNVFNIGNNKPVELMTFIKIMEDCFKKKFKLKLLPHQPGDVKTTNASTELFKNYFNFSPITELDEGMKNFANWHKSYHKNEL